MPKTLHLAHPPLTIHVVSILQKFIRSPFYYRWVLSIIIHVILFFIFMNIWTVTQNKPLAVSVASVNKIF